MQSNFGQYGQVSVDAFKSRSVERGGRKEGANDRNENESAG